MRIKPFQALRPPVELAEQVASFPYDVITSEEARALAEGHPNSFLHIVKPEIDLPPDTDPYTDAVYEKAHENFQKFQESGVLIRDPEPCLFAYRQIMNGHAQVGLVCTCHADDYDNDLIKKHEKTRQDKEDDRTRVNTTLRANPGPVFLAYRTRAVIEKRIDEVIAGEPLYDFTATDGVQHTVWRIPETDTLIDAFRAVPELYVADGHHRTASAARVAKQCRENNPEHTGDEDYNWFLSVLFPADQLHVLAYNRCVEDLNGRDAGSFLEEVKNVFEVSETDQPQPDAAGSLRMYLDGAWYDLRWPPLETADPVARLDVSVLQDRLLAPLLGVDDPRTSSRIVFVGGIHGTEGLRKRVDSGKFAVAFSLYPTSMDQLFSVADAGLMMPPKSTWFEPKLRSGLLVHTF